MKKSATKFLRATGWGRIAMATMAAMTLSMTAPAVAATQTLQQYAQMCTEMIGQIPAFDCTKGEIVPITVDGKEPAEYKKGMSCDRPSLLVYGKDTFGQCTPYSRIHDLSYNDKDKGAVQISAFCRREFLRPQDSPFYDEVDIVLHSVKSGATCWFHAEYKEGTTTGFDASRVPPPNEKKPPAGKVSADKFWWTPARTASKDCGSCHDADPFMFSPWIGQKWQKVPTDALGKYHHLGPDFAKWQSSAISTRDNTCTGCHRIGDKASCKGLTADYKGFILYASGMATPPGGNKTANSYPLSHWMPVSNNQSLEFWQNVHLKSIGELLTCCNDPKNPICTITPLTSKK